MTFLKDNCTCACVYLCIKGFPASCVEEMIEHICHFLIVPTGFEEVFTDLRIGWLFFLAGELDAPGRLFLLVRLHLWANGPCHISTSFVFRCTVWSSLTLVPISCRISGVLSAHTGAYDNASTLPSSRSYGPLINCANGGPPAFLGMLPTCSLLPTLQVFPLRSFPLPVEGYPDSTIPSVQVPDDFSELRRDIAFF